MGNVSMDISVEELWNSWVRFRRGKRRTAELDDFAYHLEEHLFSLEEELRNGTYCHGPYRQFMVSDNKKRLVSVASVRDRVVHRLLYDYLVYCFDAAFIYDAWSCRRDKGLLGAIERAQEFLQSFPRGYVWRGDIRKFFDMVSHEALLSLLPRRIADGRALWLAREIVNSFVTTVAERERESSLARAACRSGISPARYSPIYICMNLTGMSRIL